MQPNCLSGASPDRSSHAHPDYSAAVGDRLPDSEAFSAAGVPTTLHQALGAKTTIVYFMRSASCPICNSHLKKLESSAKAKDYGVAAILVVVPGDASDAAAVERRHPDAAFSVLASETAHAQAALVVKMGMQQSGTFVVDSAGRVTLTLVATVPTKSFDRGSAMRAVAGSPSSRRETTARRGPCAPWPE